MSGLHVSRRLFNRALLAMLVLLLAGCATRSPRPHAKADATLQESWMSERESALYQRDRFQLAGRIAISDGKDGGSGRFEWQQNGLAFTLRFMAPAGAQSWQLESRPGQAVLVESNGAVRVADSAETLLRRELRWQLPADALRYWVLGMRAPGPGSEFEFSADGELLTLRQGSWEIRYLDYDRRQSPPLPTRLNARSGEHQVRISVRQWRWE